MCIAGPLVLVPVVLVVVVVVVVVAVVVVVVVVVSSLLLVCFHFPVHQYSQERGHGLHDGDVMLIYPCHEVGS